MLLKLKKVWPTVHNNMITNMIYCIVHTCLLSPSILPTISLEYGCSSTYLNKPVWGSDKS
jgi:hypothetical protein